MTTAPPPLRISVTFEELRHARAQLGLSSRKRKAEPEPAPAREGDCDVVFTRTDAAGRLTAATAPPPTIGEALARVSHFDRAGWTDEARFALEDALADTPERERGPFLHLFHIKLADSGDLQRDGAAAWPQFAALVEHVPLKPATKRALDAIEAALDREAEDDEAQPWDELARALCDSLDRGAELALRLIAQRRRDRQSPTHNKDSPGL